MEHALVLGILGIALIDSINPSALIATGYILKKAPESTKTSGVIAYVSGIFFLYFLTGTLLLLGLNAIGPALESRPAYIIQAIIGALLFAWSLLPPKSNREKNIHPSHFNTLTLFLLGITITFVEFSTALPYLGALSLLQEVTYPLLFKVFVLIIYNVIFIAPPLILLLIYTTNRTRYIQWQEKQAAKKNKKPDDTMQWIAGILGVLLVLNALAELNILPGA